MHVDPRLRPEEQAGQVGDRGHRRALHLAGAAQAREHDRHGRIGRHDDVGVVFGDRACERPRAEQAQQPRGQRAYRRDVVEQAVDDRVGPRDEAQLHAVAVLDDRFEQPAHRRQPVDDRDLGGLRRVLELRGQRAGSGRVPLADVGREDQNTTRPWGPARCRFAAAKSHLRKAARPVAGAWHAAHTYTVRTPRARAFAAAFRFYIGHHTPARALDVTMSRCRPPRPCRARPSRAHRRADGRLSAARRPPARRSAPRSRARSACSGSSGIVATVFLIAAGAAGEPSQYVPARSGGWPPWLAGPLEGLGMSLGSGGFQTLTLIMCASYLLVLAFARALSLRALVAAVARRARDPAARAAADLPGRLRLPRLRAPRRAARPRSVHARRRAGVRRRSLLVRRLALPALALRPAVHAAQLRRRAARPRRRAVGAEGRRRGLAASRPSRSSRVPPASSASRGAGRSRSSG